VADANHDTVERPTPEPTAMPDNASIPPGFENVKAVLVPATTPVESFYITTKNFIDPTVDGNSWRLSFGGMVDNPYSITLADLKAMPSFVRDETLACISNPVGGDLVGNATWRGVDFAALIRKAKPQKGAVDIICRADDGYADSFPLEVALNNECMLVYEMNGQPLTNKHGYPARLLVPNIYGMKNVKWITGVEVANFDFKGYWESQGWDDVAIYNTLSRIDYPNTGRIDAKPLYIGGVAFAGNRGVKKVEVSIDGGKTWDEAQIVAVPSKFSWVLWAYAWNPQPGSYTLKSRATDGTGQVQTPNRADTYPNGATGYHTRVVRVS
jgi:DMSO/TMAO reductase YedYZ molybdopterin-dependent catalytic subunit